MSMIENEMSVAVPALAAGAVAFVFIAFLYTKLAKFETGTDIGVPVLDELSLQVKSGAIAFLKTEYTYLCVFVVALALTLFGLFYATDSSTVACAISLSFVFGASLSAGAGWWGMMVATDGNAKTTAAAAGNKKTGKKGSLNDGLSVAFATGAVMGFAVVGLGLTGVTICYIVLSSQIPGGFTAAKTMQCLAGFGFGASSIALFARVAGGIYTKAADVGADLVGKVEAGIDEDDPHNPAVIADNVGDNVGDVAGMGADLFESYVGSLIAAATLAVSQSKLADSVISGQVEEAIALAFLLPAIGILASIVGFFFVSTKEEGKGWDVSLGALMFALEKGMYVAGGLFVVFAYFATVSMLGMSINIWYCVVIGLLAGVIIGKFTEYFTSFDFGPVISIKDRGMTGPATVVIQGLGVGMISCVPPTIVLGVAIVGTATLGGSYGVAISAVGMLSTLGITLATDAYGPVADNAGGLAEMAFLGKEVRAITDSLDALGNTTAATGKGFAIGSAVLTALSLLSAFKDSIQIDGLQRTFDVGEPIVLAGVLFGAMLPYLFAALTMISVGKAAAEIITEVREQFKSHKNAYGFTLGQCIRLYTEMYEKHGEGNWKAPVEKEVMPDSDKCVLISTRSSVREMIAPGTYAVLAPLIGGFLVGPRFLMGLLAGAIASGCMLAIMMANAGGAWDNSKKLCEKLGLKKSANPADRELQKACVVGDTVGDPFKDTSGPALNILIKLMSMVSLTVAPLLKDYGSAPDNQGDFEHWQYGLVPLGIFIAITLVLSSKAVNILTWDDPLAEMVSDKKPLL
jgi:K(+)-stimulated pyrophosphate-energized sodium pump